MSKLLEIKDFSIRLKKSESMLVKHLNFDLDVGNSMILLGQSGCGKTLTCKSILGVLGPQFINTGEICFDGENMLEFSIKDRRKTFGKQIAMITQNPMTAFDPSVKIGKQMDETLRVHTQLNRSERRAQCLQALDMAGLEHGERILVSYPFMLSGGMLQRVMIAHALMMDAKLIVADEPTTALDVELRNTTVDNFRRLRDRGLAILLVTHDFMVANRMGGQLLVMKDGEILETGNTKSILNNPKHPYTQELISASRLSMPEIRGISYA